MMRLLASSLLSSANHQFASASVPAAIVVVPSIRRCLLSTSTVAMGHGSHSSDNRPDILEQEKQKNLKGEAGEVMPGAPGWNPALASDSEAAVRAEKAPSLDLDELQAHSVKVIQHLHHDGAAPDTSAQVHNPSSDSPAIQENMKASEEKLKDAHDPL